MSYCGMPALDFMAMPLGVRIRLAASDCLGWDYRTGFEARFPYQRPSIPSTLVGKSAGIDCSSFTTYVLATAYPDGKWNSSTYSQLQIFDGTKPWSPINAVFDAGVGSQCPHPVAGAWHITQAWRSLTPLSGGHVRLCYSHENDANDLLVLESTSRGDVGPRWSRTTWSSLVATYKAGVACAVLSEG